MKLLHLCLVFLCQNVRGEYPGPIDTSIDSNADGMPDKLRYADDIPIYPGSRCGENFKLSPPDSDFGRNTDTLLCVGRPVNGAKEQDGDSGGPVYTEIDGVRVQVGVNTGSYPADYFRNGGPADTHIGYYTRVDSPTIKPWLAEILAGNLAAAKAMTCSELGGKTSPDPNPPDRRRLDNNGKQRRLISGATEQATETQFPELTSTGGLYTDESGTKVWDAGCDGTLIKSNAVLLAAHCFTNTEMEASKDQMRLWPGAWNIADPGASESKMRFASEVIRHPCYTLTNYPACLDASYPNDCSDKSKPMEDIAVAILEGDAAVGLATTPLLGQGDHADVVLEFPVLGTIAGLGRYCDPAADEDPSKCTMEDYIVPSDGDEDGDADEVVDGDSSGMTLQIAPLWLSVGLACLIIAIN
ncbi:hypothetical protein TrCOL_g5194 [Triparma columacea]|uniref:Peptidase S1 domain-containing protein n=1 Tax=Triparma columacea TaxID=722753 RepID=A0A9W7GSF4_9STRA|nr:hypothetical protein TrCOL_g5194 [Triparma columacea]